MKLRNKKTGEIAERSSIVTLRYKISSSSSSLVEAEEFGSIEQLNEDWEDYKPTEPLIKDEKIRKAVRAWAEAIGTASAFVEQGSFDNEHLELSDVLNRICFVTKRPKDIKAGIRYTITELCGSEE